MPLVAGTPHEGRIPHSSAFPRCNIGDQPATRESRVFQGEPRVPERPAREIPTEAGAVELVRLACGVQLHQESRLGRAVASHRRPSSKSPSRSKLIISAIPGQPIRARRAATGHPLYWVYGALIRLPLLVCTSAKLPFRDKFSSWRVPPRRASRWFWTSRSCCSDGAPRPRYRRHGNHLL